MKRNLNITSVAFSWPSILYTLWRYKWLVAAVILLCGTIGGVIGLTMPKSYVADALILVDPQKIPDKYVGSAVNTEVQDRLATISQQILSTTRLQAIVDQFHLYQREKQRMYPEELLEMMRKKINIKLERGWSRDRPGAFHVSYEGNDPATVAQVTNNIVGLFIEQNLRDRENSAEGTSDFLDAQLREAQKSLQDQEDRLTKYKLAHQGELPSQESMLGSTLGRLQMQLQASEDGINRAQQNKAMLDSSLRVAESTELMAKEVSNQMKKRDVAAEPAAQLSVRAKQQLAEARARYSENYPEVQALKAEVARLEANEAAASKAQAKLDDASKSGSTAKSPEALQIEMNMYGRVEGIKAQIKANDDDIVRLQAEKIATRKKISEYQAHMEHLPISELEMSTLNRDHEISLGNYKSLLDKKIAAQMSTELERRQKGENFRILDPARTPQKPLGLSWQAIASIGAGVGLLMGIALAFIMQMQKNAILGEWELPLHVTLLGRVPVMYDALPGGGTSYEMRKRMKTVRLSIAVAAGLLALLMPGLYILFQRGH
jgi:succinoglycan biosynthesis transport protein ExoP